MSSVSDDKGCPTTGRPAATDPTTAAEPVSLADPTRFAHLKTHRGLIIRRALLSTLFGAALPVPVVDDLIAGRLRAGLFAKLASNRGVGLGRGAADTLAEAPGTSTLRNITLTAATLIAMKRAWRKFFALLAAGRGAEEAANTYQTALLFDHYCARMHVGAELTSEQASLLRQALHSAVKSTRQDTLIAIFREGTRVLGRSLLQAPGWARGRLNELAQRWVIYRGNPEAAPDDAPLSDSPDNAQNQWLERASRAVESRIETLGNDYMDVLIYRFDKLWTGRPKPQGHEGTPDTPAKSPDQG